MSSPFEGTHNQKKERALVLRQLLQQRLRLLEVALVVAFREPPVHRSQQFACLLHLALVTPETCIVEGCKFLGLDLLSAQYSSAAARNGSRGGAQADQSRTPPLAPFKRHGATSGVAVV
jgi:hypothetical protein